MKFYYIHKGGIFLMAGGEGVKYHSLKSGRKSGVWILGGHSISESDELDNSLSFENFTLK